MDESERGRVGGWLASNTAAALWTFVLGFGLALFLLPIDSDYLFLNILVPAIAVAAALFWRRRWLAIALVGLLLTLAANTLLPAVIGGRQVYFVQCTDPIRCFRSITVREAGMQATVYPVVDPVKWWIWSRLARRQERFRLVDTGWMPSGEMVLHAPFERALAKLAGDEGDGVSANGKMALPLGTLKLDVRLEAGEMAGDTGYGVTRRTFLRWTIPLDENSPGLFSAVGRSDDFLKLVREAVGADLQARALLAGRWREVISALERPRGRSLRERVRGDYLADMLLDRSVSGNVFSLVRLTALRRALPALLQLRRERPDSDALLRAAVFGHANMLVSPQGPPSKPSEEHDYDPADLDRFDEETLALFGLAASLDGIAVDATTVAQRAQKLQADWESDIRSPSPQPRIDPRKVPALFGWAADGEADANSLNTGSLEASLAAASNEDERDRLLYYATHTVRARFGGMLQDVTRSADPKRAKLADVKQGMREDFAYITEMEKVLSSQLKSTVPAKREIILSEIRGLADTRRRMVPFLSDLKQEAVYAAFVPEDRSYFIMTEAVEKGGPVSPFIVEYNGNCAWYDPDFRDHTALNFMVLLSSTKPKDRWLWKAAIPKLWRGYSPEGPCPKNLPGLMLLHVALTVSDDARSARTRRQVDAMMEADAGWVAPLYAALGRSDAYQPNSMIVRLGIKERN